MRLLDSLLQTVHDPDPEVRRLALHQMRTVRIDDEAEDLVGFLRQLGQRDESPVSTQARRTLRELYPRTLYHRYRLRQPSTQSTIGTWTEYNIDRSQIEKLKRLGLAQSQDFSRTPGEQFVLSAAHLLDPLVEQAILKLSQSSEALRLEAIGALGFHPLGRARENLVSLASQSPTMTRAVAGALGLDKSDESLEHLVGLAQRCRDDTLRADVLVELGSFDRPRGLEILKGHVRSGSPAVRSAVASALASYGELGAGDLLAGLVRDPDRRVGLWAMHALGRLARPELVPLIVEAFDEVDDLPIRRMAVRAAIDSGSREALGFLLDRIGHPDPRIQAAAIEGCIRLDLPETELFRVVFPLVRAPHPEVVAHAVLALAPIDLAMAYGKIRVLLSDPSPQARAHGTWCLGYVQSPSSMAMLRQAVFKDPDEGVTLTAVRSMGRYDDPEAADPLLSVMKHQNVRVRITAARVLGQIRDGDVARRVFSRLGDMVRSEPDARTRAAIIGSMARLGDSSQHLLVSRGLTEQAKEVVQAAIEGLDILGNLDSVAQIEPFIEDPRADVKARAATALWHQGEMKVLKKLSGCLESRDDLQVVGALRALGEILISVRGLQNTSTFIMLLSELQSNLKTPGFAQFEQELTGGGPPSVALSSSPRMEPFEFQNVHGAAPQGFDAPSSGSRPVTAASSPGIVPIPPPSDRGPVPAERPPAIGGPAPHEAGPEAATSRPVAEEDLDIFRSSGGLSTTTFLDRETPFPEDDLDAPAPPEVAVEEALSLAGGGNVAGAFQVLDGLTGPAALPALMARCSILLARLQQNPTPEARERARQVLERLAGQDPDGIEARVALVQIAHDTGDDEATCRRYLEAVDIALRRLAVELGRARDLLDQHGPALVAAHLKELNRHLPHLAQLGASVGELAFRSGHGPDAFGALHRAHLMDPANRALTLLLARVAHKAGRTPLARQLLVSLVEAKDLAPEIAERARQLLARL